MECFDIKCVMVLILEKNVCSRDKIHNRSLSGLNERDRETGSNKLGSVIFSMGGSDTTVNKYNKSPHHWSWFIPACQGL